MKRCTYLLPIRRKTFSASEAAEIGEYLSILAADCEVIVVDGSPAKVFAEHDHIWSAVCRHAVVDPRFRYLNNKVNGIHTGVGLATHDKLILADDDIRYTPNDVARTCQLLDDFEVVRPQNYLAETQVASASSRYLDEIHGQDARATLPWWAKMESARMLINRATLAAADYPGTCAFRRGATLRAGEYDGDVLFDNEEIIRHFAQSGALICYMNDFFIRKRTPKFRKWLEQRPRQAYEDFGLRAKTALFAGLLPCAGFLWVFFGLKWTSMFALFIAVISTLVAAAGWARGSARNFFPFHICLFAPLWVAERSLSTYWAVYWYLRRGGYPFGDRLLSKGIGRDWTAGGKIAAQMATISRSRK